jgi:hypothetical protein
MNILYDEIRAFLSRHSVFYVTFPAPYVITIVGVGFADENLWTDGWTAATTNRPPPSHPKCLIRSTLCKSPIYVSIWIYLWHGFVNKQRDNVFTELSLLGQPLQWHIAQYDVIIYVTAVSSRRSHEARTLLLRDHLMLIHE